MKKIIGIIFASLMFCNIGFAEIREIEKGSIKHEGDLHYRNYSTSGVTLVCIDGYKFVVTRGTNAISTVQFYEVRNDFLLPAEC